MSLSVKTTPAQSIRDLLSTAEIIRALKSFTDSAEAITEEHVRICQIPASPFAETARSRYLSNKFVELGLSDVEIDEEGNAIGLWKGTSARPLMVVSAHLDTVFPSTTDFTVHRRDGKLLGPGISDDGSGLAALIAVAEVLHSSNIRTIGSILFVGTVGEEGEGNLRGVRYLLSKGRWATSIDAFLSFDGPGLERITNRALGSRRYRVELRGPGGHSWGDFGTPNPIHAAGRAVARLATYPAPREPRTTFNVGKISGGTGINAIPSVATLEIDLRSSDHLELLRLDAYFRRSVTEAIDEENRNRRIGDPPLTGELNLIGERPTGETDPNSVLVELAHQATVAVGFEPRLDQSSTDSNLPISLGIPAITLGAGGASGGSHTLEEWYDPSGRDLGLKRGLLVILGMVGVVR